VAFLLDVFTCFCLLHNLFRFEHEANIAWLLWIIKLEVGVHEQGHHRVVDEPMNQSSIKDQDRYGNVNQAWIKGQERYGNVNQAWIKGQERYGNVNQAWIKGQERYGNVNQAWIKGQERYGNVNQAWIRGQERYGNVIRRGLVLYLGRQKNFQWIISEFILFIFCQSKHVIKNVESFFFYAFQLTQPFAMYLHTI
jgi:hypothetical protein